MSVLVTVGALVLIAVLAIGSYNRLVGLRRRVTLGWRQLDALRKQRYESTANLVAVVNDAGPSDDERLERVVVARQRAAGARGPADAGRRESELSAALGAFFVEAASDPRLNGRHEVRAVEDELIAVEHQLEAARHAYNAAAAKYNAAAEALPGNVIAGFAGFKAAELFELTSRVERPQPPSGRQS
jgi:LemA protein